MFCIVDNESGDYFVIPVNYKDDWDDWLYSDQMDEETPHYAEYIGGFPTLIKFDNWEKI